MLGHRDQIPLGDILGARHNLHRGPFPDVHLADPHVVGILMALNLHHAANHHVGNFSTLHFSDLNLGAGEGHVLGKGAVVSVHGDELIEPFSRQ